MPGNREILTIGVDLGGTKMETALIDAAGHILSSHRRLTHPEKDPDRIIADIVTSAETCQGKAGKRARALGIRVAGQVDRAGTLRFAPNLDWGNVPLQQRLEEALSMPVVVNNDVRAATWGE